MAGLRLPLLASQEAPDDSPEDLPPELELDPSQVSTKYGNIQTWAQLSEALAGVTRSQAALKGAGLRILTETVTSLTVADQIQDMLIRFFPQAKWHQWEPAGRDAVRAGA